MKIETSCIVAFLNGTNCQFVDYKYQRSGHYTFILVQLLGNSLSMAQKVHEGRKQTLNNIVKSRSIITLCSAVTSI